MNCPFCKSYNNHVVDKRAVKGSGEIRRRRECLKCHGRFTTYERLAKLELMVLKKDGRRQQFDRNKLLDGITKALEKRPGIDKAISIADKIENKLRLNGDREISSKAIGKAVLAELKELDKVAYLRFASVYKQFRNQEDFAKELSNLGNLKI